MSLDEPTQAGPPSAYFTLEAFEARELAAALVNAATESERWR